MSHGRRQLGTPAPVPDTVGWTRTWQDPPERQSPRPLRVGAVIRALRGHVAVVESPVRIVAGFRDSDVSDDGFGGEFRHVTAAFDQYFDQKPWKLRGQFATVCLDIDLVELDGFAERSEIADTWSRMVTGPGPSTG